jgi:DnaJ-class molecular chaperone
MTHYQTLGVAENASSEEIKKAYRKLASQHHPDKGGDTQRFQEIQTAYDVISNPTKRQQYDVERQGGGPGVQFHFHSGDINEIFRNFGFSNDPFAQFRQQQPRRNKDLRIEIVLQLASTLHEQVKTISVQTTNGNRETVEVRIPRGIANGANIKYPGLGDNLFNTIPRGDLYIQINIQNAENFVVYNIDLHTKIRVNCFTAVAGGVAEVKGLDNKLFIISIPPGTQPNTKFRIPKQGLYQVNTENRGDLYADVEIVIPTQLPNEQLEIVKSLINTQ